MRHKRAFALIALALGILVALARGPSVGLEDVAHESIRLHLKLLGASIYEYHAQTGKWPSQWEDLAQTSLPWNSPCWRTLLEDEVNVVVWHKSLKPAPADNANQILAYHNKGTLATSGQSWVCWGDLRTEYIKTEDLRQYLKQIED